MSATQLKVPFAVFTVFALLTFGLVGCKGSSDAAAGGADKASAEAAGATATDIDNGGITKVPTDQKLVTDGEKLFASKTCNACHGMSQKKVGPALGGVTERRSAAWLAQMIMHPDQMIKKDPEAKKLYEEYGTPMATPPVSAEETKAIIAYLGTQK